jgi:hypothetical protein
MNGQLLTLIVLACIVGGLLATLVHMRRGNYGQLANRMARKTRDSFEVLKPCPICHTMLKRGETVHSVVFGKKNEDTIAHIFGCPYCYPDTGTTARICPVCMERLPADGYLIARMFERPTKRNEGPKTTRHVHVLGCTECRNKRGRRGGSTALRKD